MGRCYVLFALILLHVSWCTCVTVTPSRKDGTLSHSEESHVYQELSNLAEDIPPGNSYYNGHIFSKYINVGGKGVALRLTRWSNDCSVKMSGKKSKGSELKAAFKTLLPTMERHVCRKGSEWAAVSNKTYWIDYFVRETYNDDEGGEEALVNSDDSPAAAAGIQSPNSGTDCTIQPSKLLSHHSAKEFHKLNAGESLKSPNGKYELIVNPLSFSGSSCYATLREVETLHPLWSTTADSPQNKCYLRFRSVGRLELWNNDELVWDSPSACLDLTECAGAASLVVEDGGVMKLFSSLNDEMHVYWYTSRDN